MPKYLYVAKEKEGQTVRGEVEAPDKARALVILREKDLLVLKLEESKKSSVRCDILGNCAGVNNQSLVKLTTMNLVCVSAKARSRPP